MRALIASLTRAVAWINAGIAKIPLPINSKLRLAGLWLLILLTVVCSLWIIHAVWGLMPPWIKQLFVLATLLLSVLLWFAKGQSWLERRRPFSKAQGDLQAGNSEQELTALKAMRQSLVDAKSVLAHSPEVGPGRSPLYRIPWFLLLGDKESKAERLLKAASTKSPFAPPAQSTEPAQYWRWWFLRGLVAIEADSRFVCDSSEKDLRGIWYQALQLLNSERKSLPLNGIIVLISAEKILRNEEDARRSLLNLRRLVHECMSHLHLVPPVYLLISDCESLPGHGDFVKAIPAEVLAQAIGYRFEASGTANAVNWQQLPTYFSALRDRLHGIRLTALRREADPAKRKGIWDYVESFGKLENGLISAVKLLVEENSLQIIPPLRGIYFVSGGAFIDDVFTRFLPPDQPLASRTKQPGLKRWLNSMISVVLVAAFSGLVVNQVVKAQQQRQSLRELIQTACAEVSQRGGQLTVLSDCASALSRIEALEREAAFSWGLQDYKTSLAEKKTLLVTEFKKILDAYDAGLQSNLGDKDVRFDQLLATTQRLSLAGRCHGAEENCKKDVGEHNLVFDPSSRVVNSVRKFLVGTDGEREKASDALLDLYIAYLRWGRSHATDVDLVVTEQSKLKADLEQILAAGDPTIEEVVSWSRRHGRPVTVEGLWLSPDPKTAADPSKFASVEYAYTRELWETVFAPTVAQITRTQERSATEKKFRTDYFEKYFLSWREFLAVFHKGLNLHNKQTAASLLERAELRDTPYDRLWETVRNNLLQLPLRQSIGDHGRLAWGGIKEDWTSVFGQSWRFTKAVYRSVASTNSVAPPIWLSALQHSLRTNWTDSNAKLAPFFSRLKSDENGAKSLLLAKEIFKSNGDAPPEFVKLKQIVAAPPAQFDAELKGEDRPAWEAVSGEVKFLLALISYRAGLAIDDDWQARVLPEIKKKPADMQRAALKDNLLSLSKGTLDGLINETEKRPKEVLGIKFPFSPAFINLVGGQAVVDTHDEQKETFRLATLELSQRSSFGVTTEGEKGTTLEIDCVAKKFSVNTNAGSKSERRLDIVANPTECTTARIKIALPEIDQQADEGTSLPGPSELTKTYSGDVLKAMMDDFKHGQKSLSLADFKSSYSDEEWQQMDRRLKLMGINQARVYLMLNLTPEMEGYLQKRQPVNDIPSSVIQ
jgi:type VI secretion system protein ImpL